MAYCVMTLAVEKPQFRLLFMGALNSVRLGLAVLKSTCPKHDLSGTAGLISPVRPSWCDA